ncbi:hypothetical protein BST20_05110 [Mycobacterium branderi]|uniref:Uncharacterized protein n=1 Tax=Mycobacterium branderi TaxID=43348 RepID=A0AA91RK38_9MYCO|nr:hypothetical protein BST20_05110 [Mycobacterium branderi]
MQVRSHAAQLRELGGRYGVTELAFASAGRLIGRIDNDRDLFDMFELQRAATDLVGGEIVLFSADALANENVSPDLQSAARM